MTVSEILTIAGMGITLVIAVGGIIVRDRQLRDYISQGDNALHQRVDGVLAQDFVRRTEMTARLQELQRTLDGITQRIDKLFDTLSK